MSEKEDILAIIEWAEHYLRHRDLVLRRMQEMKTEEGCIEILNKDGSREHAIPMPDLSAINPGAVKETTIFITWNSKANLKALETKWESVAKCKEISIIFINPESQLETKWIIRPYVHSRICDEKTLKTGLKAMFDTVEEHK